MKKIIIAITGASGVIFGIRLLELLKQTEYEVHLIISEAGLKNIELETDYCCGDVRKLAEYSYDYKDISASLASGSFLTDGMIVVPCTIKTLSGIANCYTDNLIVRAADVTLKEQRKLVLVLRETPLHLGHLRLMTLAAESGACILPPTPSFYHQPKTIDDLINQTIGKIFDYFKIDHDLFMRWGVMQKKNNYK